MLKGVKLRYLYYDIITYKILINMTPRTKVYNPYYYVKDGVIYRISSTLSNPSDSCAKHYVVFETEPKELKKGYVYLDLNGNNVKAESDGTYNVSTGKLNNTECAKVFPYISVTDAGEDSTVYYNWLDNFISVGDTKSTKFEKTLHGETEDTVDFAKYYIDTVKTEIAENMINGTSFDDAKKKHPSYLFAKKNDEITIDGKDVKVSSMKASYQTAALTLPIISEDGLESIIIDIINRETIECANSMLNNIGKEVNPGTSETPTKLITSSNIRSLD